MTALTTSSTQFNGNLDEQYQYDDESELARARLAAGYPDTMQGPGPLSDGQDDQDFVELLADMDLPGGDRN